MDLTPAYKYLLDKEGNLSAILLAKQQDEDIEHIPGLYVNYFDTESKLSINDFIFLPDYAFIDSYRFIITANSMFVIGTYSNSSVAGMDEGDIQNKPGIRKTPGSDGMFVYEYDLKTKGLVRRTLKPFSTEEKSAIEGNNPLAETYIKKGKPDQTLYLLTSEYYNKDDNSIDMFGEFCENEFLDKAVPYLTTRGNIFTLKFSLESNKLEWIN